MNFSSGFSIFAISLFLAMFFIMSSSRMIKIIFGRGVTTWLRPLAILFLILPATLVKLVFGDEVRSFTSKLLYV